jgi:hypothetical protein
VHDRKCKRGYPEQNERKRRQAFSQVFQHLSRQSPLFTLQSSRHE